jgi:hypothetical protein
MTAVRLILHISDEGRGSSSQPPSSQIDPADTQSLPESGYGLPIIQSVFPAVRAIRVHGGFGLEVGLPLR